MVNGKKVYDFVERVAGTGRCPHSENRIETIKPYRESSLCSHPENIRKPSCCVRDCPLIWEFELVPTSQWNEPKKDE